MTRVSLTAPIALLGISVGLFGLAVFRLAPVERPEQVTRKSGHGTIDVHFVRPMSASIGEVQEALDANPFNVERQRPAKRYGVFEINSEPAVEPSTNLRVVRLLGTTVAGDRSFALVEQPGAPPKVVKLNESFLGFRVSKIERGRLTITGRDSTIVFDINKGRP